MIDAVWVLCQMFTAIAYFHIPFEIWGWTRRHDIHGLQRIAWLFIGFIVFCGSHHAMMLWTMRHSIPVEQIFTDVPMAAFSVATSWFLIQFRQRIRDLVTHLVEGME